MYHPPQVSKPRKSKELIIPPHPLSFPTRKTVPRHPLGDGCQVSPPPPPPGTALPQYTHIFRHRLCTGKQKNTVAGLSCLQAHKRCGDMHHHALNIQQPAPKQVPLWSGCTSHVPWVKMAVLSSFSESEQNVLPRVQGIQVPVPHNTITHTVSHNQKICVDQVTVPHPPPPPPPGEQQGVGQDREGGMVPTPTVA